MCLKTRSIFNMKRLAYIVLNYNNFADTIECVESIKGALYSNYFIVIVDNNSTDMSYEKISNRYHEDGSIHMIKSEKNIGYAGGNNIGIKYAINNGADVVCVINNDTIIDKTTPTQCIEYLYSNANVAFVGPTILEFNESKVQSTGGIVNFKKGGARLLNHGAEIDSIRNNVECDFISGACLFFKAELVDEIGLIPENYFLFYEETEWCYKAKKAGHRNVCLSNVYIKHKGSVTIQKVGGLSDYLLHRNRVVFAKRNVDTKFNYLCFLLYIYLEALYVIAKGNKEGFKYFKYYHHGLFNKIDYNKYPFIIINEEK